MIRTAAKSLARLVLEHERRAYERAAAAEVERWKRRAADLEVRLADAQQDPYTDWKAAAKYADECRVEAEKDRDFWAAQAPILNADLKSARESARLVGELNVALSAECQDAKARADAGESLYDAVKGYTEPDDWAPSLTDLAKAQATYERAAFGKVSEHLAHAAPVIPANANPCGCWACLGDKPVWHMVLCPTCGNKRCPKANDHKNECSGSNEPGQKGSAYE